MDLFRKSALQKMHSPEQLDQLIVITNPRDWIALLGVCGILLVIIFWSIWGKITIDIPGSGIIIRPGGYRVIVSPVEGMIIKVIQLKSGALIPEGEVVAEISNPLLPLEIETTQTYLTKLTEELKKAESKRLPEADKIRIKILDTEYDLKKLQVRLETTSKIRSPYSGYFLAMRSDVGVYVRPGDSILSLEDVHRTLEVAIFLPPDTNEIEAIKPGMLAKVFPGISKDAEHGYLVGRVREVTKFPASPQVMMNFLNNEQLVKYFSEKGPPYIVYVDLIPDLNTVSGYQWSSASGKKVHIASGTLSSVLIQIASEPPINLIIPNIRKSDERLQQ